MPLANDEVLSVDVSDVMLRLARGLNMRDSFDLTDDAGLATTLG